MQFELLQLLGLIALICLAFKYFFLSPSKKPEPEPVPEASKQEKKEEKEMELSSKYMPSDGKIEQQQNQSEQESLKMREENKQPEMIIKVHFQAEEKLNQSDPCEFSQKQMTFMPVKSDKDNQSKVDEEKGSSMNGGDSPSQQLFLSQLKKQEKDSGNLEAQAPKQFLEVLAQNGNLKFGETQSNDYQRSSSRHDVQVKDVVSQCQQLDIPQEQVHSNAYRIEVSQLQCKRRHKLKVVKQHYKSIIQNLKRKLQEVCIKHNQSIGSDINNQTITFSEEQSSFFAEEQKAQLQVKVEEVATLRTELQLHEQILTTIIEEDSKLKDQLKELQQQNNELKTALQASMIRSQQGGLNLSGARSDKIVQSQAKSEDGVNSISGNKILSDGIQGVQSRIIELYTSQIFCSSPLKSSLFASSQALPKTSTISMMSLIEGVFTIGLLGQCRFLNQISKKFMIGEIKKFRKQKMTNARLIYSFQQQTGDYNTSIYAGLSQVTDLLILIKTQNSSIGIFTDRIYSQEDGQYEELTESKFLLLNLSKRKSQSRQGVCFYSNNVITFGEEEEGCLSEFPPFIFKGGKWCGQLQQKEKVKNVAIFQLTLQSQEQ